MQTVTVACVQPRMIVPADREEFEAYARRFLRQAQAKGARITLFPELSGLMLAPPLISGLKLGLVKREDEGKRPGAGFVSRSMARLSGAAAGALGGGFRGSLGRLLRKNSDTLRDLYFDSLGGLAREFGTIIVGGSLYLYDAETGTVRHRAYIFDIDGEVLGWQDKLNLAPDERDLASPGTDVTVVQSRYGVLGLLIGRDALYPELARLLAVQGAELIAGIAASPGHAQSRMVRSALALRAEENQVFAAASFLLGPNSLGRENIEDFYGQSAVLAPISLSPGGDGVLVQAGTSRTEGLIAADLDAEALSSLWQTSGFRPRHDMNLGNMSQVLADLYQQQLTIEQAIEQRLAGPAEVEPPVVEMPVALPIRTPEPEPSAAEPEEPVSEPASPMAEPSPPASEPDTLEPGQDQDVEEE
jgi:predicted amidohydrolase